MYVIRDENGIMLMKVKNDVAQRIIKGVPGVFKPYKPTADTEVVCYQITVDSSMLTGSGRFYLWAGTKLIPSTEVPTVGMKDRIKQFFGVKQ